VNHGNQGSIPANFYTIIWTQSAKTRPRNELPTVWEVPDALWEKIVEPILTEFDPPHKRGRPRADSRLCLNGMIYRARTGCQWNHLPPEFGDDATVCHCPSHSQTLGRKADI
jgi:hypothetical protein